MLMAKKNFLKTRNKASFFDACNVNFLLDYEGLVCLFSHWRHAARYLNLLFDCQVIFSWARALLIKSKMKNVNVDSNYGEWKRLKKQMVLNTHFRNFILHWYCTKKEREKRKNNLGHWNFFLYTLNEIQLLFIVC